MENELTVQQAAEVLETIDDAAEDCRTEITQYSNEQNIESEKEALSHELMFEALYKSGGSDTINFMNNCLAEKFMRIQNQINSFVNKTWSVGK